MFNKFNGELQNIQCELAQQEMIKRQLERQRVKWFESKTYTDREYFRNFTKSILCKDDTGNLTIKEIKEKIIGENDCDTLVKFSSGLADDLIPLGRKNSEVVYRDYEFYKNTLNLLENNDFKNTFFISYTGHGVAIAAALKEKNIDVSWNMKLDVSSIAEERILGQLQDYSEILSRDHMRDGKNNCSLMLESPHFGININLEDNPFNTIYYGVLPKPTYIKERGINNVVILLEKPADEKVIDSYFSENRTMTSDFKRYIEGFKKEGFNISFVGVDEKTNGEKFSHEVKLVPVDTSKYESNFNMSGHSK